VGMGLSGNRPKWESAHWSLLLGTDGCGPTKPCARSGTLGYSFGGAGNYSVRQFGDTACFSRIELIDTPYHRCARTMHTCQWTPSMPQRATHALACNSAGGLLLASRIDASTCHRDGASPLCFELFGGRWFRRMRVFACARCADARMPSRQFTPTLNAGRCAAQCRMCTHRQAVVAWECIPLLSALPSGATCGHSAASPRRGDAFQLFVDDITIGQQTGSFARLAVRVLDELRRFARLWRGTTRR
jgi:hypothetical protein